MRRLKEFISFALIVRKKWGYTLGRLIKMYLRKTKVNKKAYYQIFSNDKKFLMQLGTVEKILVVFSFWNKYKNTISELFKLGIVDKSSGEINSLVTKKLLGSET